MLEIQHELERGTLTGKSRPGPAWSNLVKPSQTAFSRESTPPVGRPAGEGKAGDEEDRGRPFLPIKEMPRNSDVLGDRFNLWCTFAPLPGLLWLSGGFRDCPTSVGSPARAWLWPMPPRRGPSTSGSWTAPTAGSVTACARGPIPRGIAVVSAGSHCPIPLRHHRHRRLPGRSRRCGSGLVEVPAHPRDPSSFGSCHRNSAPSPQRT